MEYCVVAENNFKEFIQLVNERLAQNWQLTGGISVCVVQEGPLSCYHHYQAMYRGNDAVAEAIHSLASS